MRGFIKRQHWATVMAILGRPTCIEAFLFCCCLLFFLPDIYLSSWPPSGLPLKVHKRLSLMSLTQINWLRYFAHPSSNYTCWCKVRNLASIFHPGCCWVALVSKWNNVSTLQHQPCTKNIKTKSETPIILLCLTRIWYSIRFQGGPKTGCFISLVYGDMRRLFIYQDCSS